ncbi:MAG: hypothetical protein N2Z74_07250, partial [Syntrophales bacterium]|nr:hypothetical protein [Syntrophales bacterium]
MYAVPKEAATVLPLRPGKEGFEVLMVKRHPASVFVPSCYVFPGGCLDDDDCQPVLERRCRGLTREQAFAVLKDMATPAMALGAWVAAIRETFEETGILLAYDRSGRVITGDGLPSGRRFHELRKLLSTGSIT